MLDIVALKENYIELSSKNVVIFEVIPFNLTTNKKNEQQLITTIYKQFLDLYLDEFQIFILNRYLNVSNYFNKKNNENISSNGEYTKQLVSFLKEKVKKNNIIKENYYLITSFEKSKDANDSIDKIKNKVSILKSKGIYCNLLLKKEIVKLIELSLFKETIE